MKEGLRVLHMDENDSVIQLDNSPIHTSKATRQFLAEKGYNVMDWPPYSPDLNPIENVWALTQHRALCQNVELSRQSDLVQAAKAAFAEFSAEKLAGFYNSMPKRLKAVIQAKGGPTRY